MGSNCRFCGFDFKASHRLHGRLYGRRHKCSYALYENGIRHGAAKTTAKSETRQPGGWSLPTWDGYRHLPSIEYHEGLFDAVTVN
jgi:hypothetical protein